MLHFEIFVVALTTCLVATIQLHIKPDNKWHYMGRRYTESKRTLTTDQRRKIRFHCYENPQLLNTHHGLTKEQRCDSEKIVLNDGISTSTYTGCLKELSFVGNSSRLVFDLVTFPPNRLKCRARAVKEPKSYEVVKIKKKATLRFDLRDGLEEKKEQTWTLKSTTGTKLLLQCGREMPTGVFVRDILTVDAGNGPMVDLDDDPILTVTSEGSKISMSLKTYPRTDVLISCLVQSLNPDSSVPSESEQHVGFQARKNTTCPCGKRNLNAGRIINGKEVKNESRYPFMVSLRYGGKHDCGASIITPNHILTAAHCVSYENTMERVNPADIEIVVGAHRISENASHGETQTLKVKAIHIPVGWFAVLGVWTVDDIAIIELEEPMRYSKWVGPVCLPPTQPAVMNKFIKLLGWGDTEYGSSDILRKGAARVRNPRDCWNNVNGVCLGTGIGCDGDSGGPFIYVDPETNCYTQIGVFSYSDCVNYSVGTNTTEWFHWIQKVVADTSGGQQDLCYKVD